MTYDSPKQIRRRQLAAEKPRRTRQARKIMTFTDQDWLSVCDFHVGRIREEIEHGRAEAAGRHAEALAHCAVTRMALVIMGTERPGLDEAMKRAKTRLYEVEVA